MDTKTLFQQFREKLYQILPKRADAILDFIDALTVAGHVASPVALSEEGPFRRKFSAIYDVLRAGQIELEPLHELLAECQPAESESIAGYEVYALDTTPDERPEAETLADRGLLKAQKNEAVRVGQKFSWLVRLVKPGSSWVAPWDVRRVETASSDSQTGADQVQELAGQNSRPKVVVADSLYANQFFLAVFLGVKHLIALVRLRQNLTLYERPVPKPTGSRGAPRKHGPAFKMARPHRPPDRTSSLPWGRQSIRLSAWHGLHLRPLPTLVGLAVQVEFLKADGTRRYQRPMWLFWTGPESVALEAICRMYLWRFAIEHAFRFMKQHLGLNAHCLTDPATIQRWMWFCALAYWQLLLIRQAVDDLCPAWYPCKTERSPRYLTPGQVQRGSGRFLLKLGSPARPPRPAGKGRGRTKGYHPAPRQRFPVIRKSQKIPKRANPPPISAV
jgi:hypothetical protein